MGAVSGLLGVAGGAGGTGFAGPQAANVLNPTTVAQANTSYDQNQASLQSQQQLLQAIQGQNGLQNQSNVYNQLQGVANGTGPNPAQIMLNQATGANVANQAALMAGQRGASQNAGLIARQAAQQGANIQQQAVGQGASMQAQQSLNAIGAAGNLATQQAGQQIGQTNTNVGAQQSEQQNLLNSIAQQNNSNVGMQSNVNSANASLASSAMGNTGKLIGGGLSALGPAAAAAAEGGIITKGGVSGPRSQYGKMLACGGNVGSSLKDGGHVPGKPAVGGAKNSYKNDTVKALLSPGEIVLPRSVTQSNDPMGAAAKFVQAVMAKRGNK